MDICPLKLHYNNKMVFSYGFFNTLQYSSTSPSVPFPLSLALSEQQSVAVPLVEIETERLF